MWMYYMKWIYTFKNVLQLKYVVMTEEEDGHVQPKEKFQAFVWQPTICISFACHDQTSTFPLLDHCDQTCMSLT